MKLKIHSLLMISILVSIITGFGSSAWGTDVEGIIDTDTTWDLAGSPYNISSTVQIDEDVTLTIDPGVIVNGNDNNIQLWGNLTAIGNTTSKIIINNVILDELPGSSETNVNIQFAEINAGWYYFCRYGGGSFSLLDSKIQNTWFINISECSNPSFMERNAFIEIGNVHIARSGGADIYIRNNVFYKQEQYALGVQGNNAIVEHNSFLSIDRVALELSDHATSNFTAINNFWNTTDTSVIDYMIFDRNDDLSIPYYVEYIPFLTEPHPDTPIPDFNQTPIADCGDEMVVVFDEVTLDGSASYDPDGWIDLYEWTLQHRANSANNRNASGVNPTIHNLSPGFYDVCLTVTDNGGAIGLDCSLLAAAGSCFCTASTMHIESILAGSIKGKYGKVTVTVFNNCGNPVPAAEVTGTFTGDLNEIGVGVTNESGVAVITTTDQFKKPSYTFCVNDVIKGTLTYEPTDNIESCESK